MHQIALLVVSLACVGHGRRVQTSQGLQVDDELTVAQIEKKMSDAKFRNIRELERKIDEAIEDFESDPAMATFKEEADRLIEAKMREILADPVFKEIQEYQERANEQSEEFMEQAKEIDKSLSVEEQLSELRDLQEQVEKVSAEASEEMESLPNFDLFKKHSDEVIEECITALKAERRFKSVVQKSQRIDDLIQKVVSEPNFEEYQQLAELLYEKAIAQSTGVETQSLAQVSQSVMEIDEFDPVKLLSQLLRPYNLAAAVLDTHGFEAHLPLGRSRHGSPHRLNFQTMKRDWILRKHAVLSF